MSPLGVVVFRFRASMISCHPKAHPALLQEGPVGDTLTPEDVLVALWSGSFLPISFPFLFVNQLQMI